jgi:hypothetical protein
MGESRLPFDLSALCKLNLNLAVTGINSPDVTGEYERIADYLNCPCFRRLDGAVYVFSYNFGTSWIIADDLSVGSFSYENLSGSFLGDYPASAQCTGIATVAFRY